MLYVGYTAAGLFIVLGILILFADILPAINTVGGAQLKIIFGIVMFLYGVYRIVIITIKRRRDNDEETY